MQVVDQVFCIVCWPLQAVFIQGSRLNNLQVARAGFRVNLHLQQLKVKDEAILMLGMVAIADNGRLFVVKVEMTSES